MKDSMDCISTVSAFLEVVWLAVAVLLVAFVVVSLLWELSIGLMLVFTHVFEGEESFPWEAEFLLEVMSDTAGEDIDKDELVS